MRHKFYVFLVGSLNRPGLFPPYLRWSVAEVAPAGEWGEEASGNQWGPWEPGRIFGALGTVEKARRSHLPGKLSPNGKNSDTSY